MVLRIVEVAFNRFFPTQYLVHTIIGILTLIVAHAFAQGRKTSRDRDLHARTFIVTGGFTPLGLELLHNLATRGAHIIALSPLPITHPHTETLIDLLRSTTNNESVYAEECDLSSPVSIRAFCELFVKGEEKRVDGVVFAHEYQSVGRWIGGGREGEEDREEEERKRKEGALATFLLTTLLLPVLLVAPVERDIRIINVVNPFYAAALPTFVPSLTPPPSAKGTIQKEGHRALLSIVLTRHLQRILDALQRVEPPKPDVDSTSVPVPDRKKQRSNVVAVSVSPGVSRVGTVAPLMGANWGVGRGWGLGFFIYLILNPLLRILTKSTTSAIQSVLHVLFLPTPFKVPPGAEGDVEVLRPGAMYVECGVGVLGVRDSRAVSHANIGKEDGKGKEKDGKEDKKGKGKKDGEEEHLEFPPDNEYGGEEVGRAVWEAFESALKEWDVEVKK